MWTHTGGWLSLRLRRSAVQFASHGWPVLAGAALVGDRFSCGAGCPTVACHPSFVHELGMPGPDALRDRDLVDAAWRRVPHAVLLATGEAFDVIETPAWLATSAGRDAVRGPVAVTPTGRWMFLVRPGAVLRADLARLTDVVLHGEGSWIPAPPTVTPQGRVRWLVPPEEVDWLPAVGALVQAGLAAALPRGGSPRGYPLRSAA